MFIIIMHKISTGAKILEYSQIDIFQGTEQTIELGGQNTVTK